MWHTVWAVVHRVTFYDWLLLSTAAVLILYLVLKRKYEYFEKRGIASSKPSIKSFAKTISMVFGFHSVMDLLKEQYEMTKDHGVYGIFEFTKPTFLVRDPEILKVITVKDFDSFINHRSLLSEKTDPVFTKNLVNLKDQQWRDMRATMSPAFTTSKIKAMFPLISECAEQMAQHLREKCAEKPEGKEESLSVDMKDVFTRLANDVIATAAFGLSCDSLKNPENEFYKMGKALTTFTKFRSFIFLCYMMFPKLMERLGQRVLDKSSTDFFDSLVHETIRERRKKGIFRPDVLQLLMQAQEGKLKEDQEDAAETENVGARKNLTNDEVTAQAVIFFFAGFETISTALCLTTSIISHHQDEQRRLQAEISDVMERTNGKPTYESVQGMKYLDAVVNESLRMYPPALITDRQCRQDTILPPGTNSCSVRVLKGQVISIPIMGIHHDPQYWDEPEKFNPDRFSDKNKHKIKPFTYMPFGLGPRSCIAQRLALMEVKLILVHLLHNFDLHGSPKTKFPLEFQPGFSLMARNGFWCELSARNE